MWIEPAELFCFFGPYYYLLLVISAILMSTVLIKISTPLLEKNMEKYDGWEGYTKRVPMLFPFTKNKKNGSVYQKADEWNHFSLSLV
ncbi:hypothetical protein [Trichococcus patagoniensis]|uniref:hypothetical protein n=1 Tax=Trichococcus patagoniensis TaxID=382641 RepID=UPI0011B1E1FA|nr:hypothetical protein [Trichococcus patagoniensis]